MELKLFNDVGDVIGSYNIGIGEGEWDILNDDEAGQLVADMQRKVEENDEVTA